MTLGPWIPPTKLAPPVLPPTWLRRDLLAGARPAAVLFQAGAGYGKTLAMAEAAEGLAGEGKRVWITADEFDDTPQAFFHALLTAMEAHVPRFGETLRTLIAAPGFECRLVWGQIFAEAAAYNLPGLAIAIDDAHHLAAGPVEVLKGLSPHLERLPPGVHLLLTSRTRLPLTLGRLTASGRARLFGPEALRFTSAEASAFYQARHPGAEIPAAWLERVERLEGWPLGLATVESASDGSHGLPGTEALASYIAEELYARQPAERRAFMLKTSLLSELEPEVCRLVAPEHDVAAELEALEAEHLVLRWGEGGSYRYPAHLAEFLRSEGGKTLGAAAIAKVHRQAADAYMGAERPEQAMPHLVALGDWAGVARHGGAIFPELSLRGRRELVRRWLLEAPPAALEAEPLLRVWQGNLIYAEGRHAEARAEYDMARRGFQALDDEAGELKVVVRLATVALMLDDDRAFHQLLMQAQALMDTGRPEDVADFNLLRALAAEHRGDIALMEECNQAVLARPAAGNVEVASCQVTALTNLFTHALHRGDLHQAGAAIARAIALADEWGFRVEGLFARFMQAFLQLLRGETEPALALLKEAPPYWRAILAWQDRAVALVPWAYGLLAKGAGREAEEALREAMGIFEQAGYAEGRKVPFEHLLWLLVRRSQWARLVALVEAEGPSAEAASVQDFAIAIPYARARLALGEPEAAIAIVSPILAELEALGARLHLARALALAAAAHQLAGHPDAAAEARARADALVAEWDYPFLATEDPTLWRSAQPAEAPVAAVSGVPPLTIRAFGGFTVQRGDEKLDTWSRRRARAMLAALLLQPRGFTIPELVELLGEPVTQATMRTFYGDMSALRRTLEPELKKGAASSYLDSTDERYAIAWDHVAFFDLQAFDAAMVLADSLKERDPAEAARQIEAALALYQGELLDDAVIGKHFEPQREAYRRRAVEASQWLAGHYVAVDRGAEAEAALERAVAIDPTDEAAYLALMRHHHVRLAHTRVRQAYWDCRRALKAKLGIAPSEDFEAAYRALAS